MTSYVIEADGGSRGNPGPAGYGAVVKDAADGQVLAEAAESIGTATNNVAEYRGLIAGLTAVLTLAGDGATVEARMDSKLVIEQMAGRWKIKNEGLRPLALEAAALGRRLRVTWTWIPRERNKHADRLANEAMDAAAKGLTWQPSGSGADPGAGSGGASSAVSGGASRADSRGASGATRAAARGPVAEPLFGEPESDLLSEATAEEAGAPSGASDARATGWRGPQTTATTFLLLRHGQTPMSVERRFSGIGDPELTPAGVAQAEAAAVRLSRKPYEIDLIVTSPLKRARATAEIVAARAGAPVTVDGDLRETDFGEWEGHTFTEIHRRWPGELAAWLSDPDRSPPGGESFTAVATRVEAVRERLLGEHPGKCVLIVSHVTPIKTLLRFALEAPPAALYRMHLDLACLSLIDYYADDQAVVRAFNDTAHLH